MIYSFYTILLYIIQPLIWLRLLWRSIKLPAYRKRWSERYGFCKGKVKPNGILIHAVSVGETIAALELIKRLQQNYPHLPITVTTMTPTGSDQVHRLFGNSVSHVYLPYDLIGAMKRFIRNVQPKLVIIMETELWPNMIRELDKQQIPLILANARLSERSATRYAKLGQTIKNILSKINVVAAQNEQDGQRFLNLGLPKNQLAITGSVKFDIHLSKAQIQQINDLKNSWQTKRPILIAASTHQDEDEIILSAFHQLQNKYPDLLLILVPRHPDRFKSVAKFVQEQGFNLGYFSKKAIPIDNTDIILGDTMGDLTKLYGLATIAFVGGSLTEHGGHNPLEPALHQLPIIMGEHFFNFKIIAEQLVEAKGMLICANDSKSLCVAASSLLADDEYRKQIGNNAYQILKKNQGALDRLLTIINQYLQPK